MSSSEEWFLDLREPIVNELQRSATVCVGAEMPHDAAKSLLDRYLPDLLELLARGILTAEEVAAGITDRFAVALAGKIQRPLVETISASWDDAIARVTELIERSQGVHEGIVGDD